MISYRYITWCAIPNSRIASEQLYRTDLGLIAKQLNTSGSSKEANLVYHKLSTIEGYVNLFEAENDSLSVMLYSKQNELFETVPLGRDKKFQFKDIPLKNKSTISLTVLDKKGESVYANFFYTVQPYQIRYRHTYRASEEQRNALALTPMEDPLTPLANEIQLDEVVVTDKKLRYAGFFGEYNGRKVDSTLLNYNTLGNYMRTFGYLSRVEPVTSNPMADTRRQGSVQLYKIIRNPRYQGTIVVYPTMIFNGVFTQYAMDHADTRMDLIDEIYYGKNSRTDPGHFFVFTNEKYFRRPLAERDKNSKEFIVEKGYDAPGNFIRPPYTSFDNIGYQKWGVVGWFPSLVPDKNGIITFKVPDDGQEKLNLQLVGTTGNGTLFNQDILCKVTD